MSRKAIIEDRTGDVINVIVLEDRVPYEVPRGQSLIDAEDSNAEAGGHWDGRVFTRKPVAPPDPKAIRRGELALKLLDETATLLEVCEFLVLRHNIVALESE